MHWTTGLAFATLAWSVSGASIKDLPICAQEPVLQALTSSPCGITDLKCVCQDKAMIQTIRAGVSAECTQADLSAALNFAAQVCVDVYHVPPAVPSPPAPPKYSAEPPPPAYTPLHPHPHPHPRPITTPEPSGSNPVATMTPTVYPPPGETSATASWAGTGSMTVSGTGGVGTVTPPPYNGAGEMRAGGAAWVVAGLGAVMLGL